MGVIHLNRSAMRDILVHSGPSWAEDTRSRSSKEKDTAEVTGRKLVVEPKDGDCY